MNRRELLQGLFATGVLLPFIKLSQKDNHNFPPTNDACVWMTGTECCGVVHNALVFGGEIRVPICESHLHEHRVIMSLAQNGIDIEEVLTMTAEQREKCLASKDIKLLPWSKI